VCEAILQIHLSRYFHELWQVLEIRSENFRLKLWAIIIWFVKPIKHLSRSVLFLFRLKNLTAAEQLDLALVYSLLVSAAIQHLSAMIKRS
jgi:hypothetical protein